MQIHLFDKDTKAAPYSTGHLIFSEGDGGAEMFAVLEGEVDILIRDKLIETVGPGGVFGEMALIEPQPRNATARVRTDAKLVAIDRERFLFLVQQNPYFSLQLMAIMTRRLQKMNSRL